MSRRALLVGSPVGNLEGVESDVDALKGILSNYGFSCRTCVGKKATRYGILQAWKELIQDCQAGDAALIYFAGHGGIAENPDYRPLHEGGTPQPRYHRFIVPVDIEESTDDEFRGITNLELSHNLGKLTRQTRNVTIIFDCCHASGMCRGLPSLAGSFRARSLPEIWSRGIRPHLQKLKEEGVKIDRLDIHGNPDAVRLMATSPTQLAFEYSPPGGLALGLFTGCLTKSLEDVWGLRVSWRSLMRRIREGVQSFQYGQRPEVEGPQDRLLFVLDEAEQAGALDVKIHGARVELAGGWIHGVQVGDKYSIRPGTAMAMDTQNRITQATVTSVRAAHSEVALADDAAKIPTGAIAYPDERSLHRLTIRVETAFGAEDIGEEVRASLKETTHLRLADGDGEQSLATVQVDPHEITLLDPAGQPVVHPKPLEADVQPAVSETIENLRRFAQARALTNLASGEGAYALRTPYDVEWGQLVAGRRQRREKAGAELQVGDRIYVQVHNQGDSLLYVSFFDIGIAGKITLPNSSVAPSGVEVEANQEYVLGKANLDCELDGLPLIWNKSVPVDSGPRLETITVIVSDRPQDLTPLESPGLRGVWGESRSGETVSELTRLLSQISRGHCRGLAAPRAEVDIHYAVEHIDFFLGPLRY